MSIIDMRERVHDAMNHMNNADVIEAHFYAGNIAQICLEQIHSRINNNWLQYVLAPLAFANCVQNYRYLYAVDKGLQHTQRHTHTYNYTHTHVHKQAQTHSYPLLCHVFDASTGLKSPAINCYQFIRWIILYKAGSLNINLKFTAMVCMHEADDTWSMS